MENNQLREYAKDDMKGLWGRAALLFIVMLIIASILNELSAKIFGQKVFGLLNIAAISNPNSDMDSITKSLSYSQVSTTFILPFLIGVITNLFYLGFSWGFLGIVDGSVNGSRRELKLETLFAAFNKNFFKNLLVVLIESIAKFAYILLIIPGILLELLLMPASYILKDRPELSLGETLSKSFKLMKGKKAKLFLLLIRVYLFVLVITVIPFIIFLNGLLNDNSSFIMLIIMLVALIFSSFYLPIKTEILKAEFYRRDLMPILNQESEYFTNDYSENEENI